MNIEPELTKTLKDMLRLQGRHGDAMSLYALGLIEYLESQQPARHGPISGTESVVYARASGKLSYLGIFSDTTAALNQYTRMRDSDSWGGSVSEDVEVGIIGINYLDHMLGS